MEASSTKRFGRVVDMASVERKGCGRGGGGRLTCKWTEDNINFPAVSALAISAAVATHPEETVDKPPPPPPPHPTFHRHVASW